MERNPSQGSLSAFVILAALIPLTACNGTGNALKTAGIGSTTNPTQTDPGPTGTPTPTPTPTPGQLYEGPQEVAKYVNQFVDNGKIQGIDVTPHMKNPMLTIQISSLDSYGSTVIGLCELGGGSRMVTFDPDFWNAVDDTQRELLVHHELGHCVLGRPHRTDLLPSGAYASIMYPIIMRNGTYTADYDYYQNELFTYNQASTLAVDPNVKTIYIDDQKEVFGGQ